MMRMPLIALAAVCGLALACGPLFAQTETENEAAQRIEVLVQSKQGVLLPLDGALDPELSSVLLLPPPEDSSDQPGLQVEDSEITVMEDGTDEPGLQVEDSEFTVMEDGTDEPGLQVEDSEITVMEDGTEPGPPPDEAEVDAAIAADEEEAAVEDEIAAETETEDADTIEEAAEAVSGEAVAAAVESEAVAEEAAQAGSLPEIDAMGEIVAAELGNPTTIGPWRLWLASYRTVREAQDGWQQLAKDNRDVLGDLSPVIVMKDLGGDSGTFFRLQAGPLPDESAAKGRCDNLKSRNFYCAILGPQDG